MILPTKTAALLRRLFKVKNPVNFKAGLGLHKACISRNKDFSRTPESQGFLHTLSPSEREIYAHLVQSFKRATTPIQVVKSKGDASVQSGDQRILDCLYAEDHPVNTVAPAIQLFNPAFTFFSSNAFNPAYNVPDDVVRDVRELMIMFAQIHREENDHRSHVQPYLEKVINFPLIRIRNVEQTSPDLEELDQCEPLQTYLVVAEDKNEFGGGGPYPSVQAGFSFQRIFFQANNKHIRLRSCCPSFLIARTGPWLTIMGGIVTGDCVVQRLTDFLWIPVHSAHDDDQFFRIARVFYALRESMELLKAWYRHLVDAVEPCDESSPHPHPRGFPFPNTYKDGDNLVRFEYQVPLEHDVSCVTYRAKTLGNDPQDIVVKFVTSYGANAHRAMALAGLAPKLLYYGEIDVKQGMPSFGNLRMVVMEFVDGQTLDKALAQGKVPRGVRSDLRDAFGRLHDAGYVYGDLRSPNVMITREGELRLIDFDWAGLEGKVKYPVALSTQIDWPAGVQGFAPIRKEHDDAMLDALLKSIRPHDSWARLFFRSLWGDSE